MKKLVIIIALLAFVLSSGGCALHFYKKNPKDKEEIEKLSGEVKSLKEERALEKKQFADIEKELKNQLRDTKVKLDMEKRGLVITLANNILFDSGKAKIKDDARGVLDKITTVLNERAAKKDVGVEGHTDNVPITYSSWKSNRELSTARANDVYHYLVKRKVSPNRLTTMGYGEFRPVASNNSERGRAKNRRVEIVILPKYLKKSAKEIKDESWVK